MQKSTLGRLSRRGGNSPPAFLTLANGKAVLPDGRLVFLDLLSVLVHDSLKGSFTEEVGQDRIEFIQPMGQRRFFGQDHVDILFFSINIRCLNHSPPKAKPAYFIIADNLGVDHGVHAVGTEHTQIQF
jgi:hypothetical protein